MAETPADLWMKRAHEFAAEIDRLRARLAEVEAELRHTREFGVIASRTAGQEAARADAAEAEAREYRSAITWHTTCLSCSKVLDSAYEQTARAEAAEARLAEEGDRPAEPCRHDGSNGTCAECRLAHLYGDGDR